MSDTPRITALVRCYNNAHTVGRTIESLLVQDIGSELEIVVVDDGSTDESWSRIHAFGWRVHPFRLPTNQGAFRAAYLGLEKANGEYFCLVDADDTVDPTFARSLADALDASPEAAFAYCDYVEEDDATGASMVVEVDDMVSRMIACNAMFRLALLESEGFLDETLLLPEYDLFIRLLSRYPAPYVRQALYRYRRHERSMTRQAGFFDRAMRELAERHAAHTPSGEFRDLRISALQRTSASKR